MRRCEDATDHTGGPSISAGIGRRGRIAYPRLVLIHRLPSRDSRTGLSLFLLSVLLLYVAGCSPSPGNPKVPAGAKSSGGRHAVIETDKGAIEMEFFEADAPKAVENFRLLAEHGTTTA